MLLCSFMLMLCIKLRCIWQTLLSLLISKPLQSRGGDPSILTEDYDPYLSPGRKSPLEMAIEDESVRDKLRSLEKLYADTPKVREPHPDIGCWQTLYDYGPETVKSWAKNYIHSYPGALWPNA